jgi:hypothetical protein
MKSRLGSTPIRSDMAHLGDHLVQTDTFTGLTEALADEAIRRLK